MINGHDIPIHCWDQEHMKISKALIHSIKSHVQLNILNWYLDINMKLISSCRDNQIVDLMVIQ